MPRAQTFLPTYGIFAFHALKRILGWNPEFKFREEFFYKGFFLHPHSYFNRKKFIDVGKIIRSAVFALYMPMLSIAALNWCRDRLGAVTLV